MIMFKPIHIYTELVQPFQGCHFIYLIPRGLSPTVIKMKPF
jgi:hypothetical protein